MSNNILQSAAFAVDASAALEASSVSKATRGYLGKVYGRIDSTAATATYYLQLLNAAAVPSDGALTFLMAPVKIAHTNGTDSTFDIDFTPAYIPASSGICWCISSTEFTKTVTGAVASVTILYR